MPRVTDAEPSAMVASLGGVPQLAGNDRRCVILDAGRWKARGERVVLVVDEAEATVVRTRIFTAYVHHGLGIRAIAQQLNAERVPPPAALHRNGRAAWAKGTVWAILRNPIYVGRLVCGRARYRDVGKKRGKQQLPDAEHIIVVQHVHGGTAVLLLSSVRPRFSLHDSRMSKLSGT